MKHRILSHTLFLFVLFLAFAGGADAKKRSTTTRLDVQKQLDYCHRQVGRTLQQLRDKDGQIDFTRSPRNILRGEKTWNLRSLLTAEEWCSGFYPGVLWMDGRQEEARAYTKQLEYQAYSPVYDHDLGFIMIGSYLKGYEATGDAHYREVLLAAADTLATLYNPRVGTLLSWPRNVAMFGGHNTIIDNMINLELLLWAAENGGSPALRDIAIHHADTTMRYHFRPDHTCYHVAVYDPVTGQHLRNCTHQGLFDESLWSRGQAWAIYGYTMMYRYTRLQRYLDFAQQVTDVMLSVLPADRIPYWDMRDPAIPNTYRDASAAAVIASALFDLSGFVGGEKGQRYLDEARQMLSSLSSSRYQSRKQNPSFLLHSTGNYPAHSELDASISYADYYYIEALLKAKR